MANVVQTSSKGSAITNVLSYPYGVIVGTFYGVFTILYAIFCIGLCTLIPTKKSRTFITRTWGGVYVRLFGLKMNVMGLENLPPEDEGCIYIFNHSSLSDIPILFRFIPRHIRFGAKVELFKIPFFGMAMKKIGILPIVRDNREKVFNLYQQSIQRIKDGESFILAPESTRGNGQQINRFKAGPFVFAINAEARIVPVVLENVWSIHPKSNYFPGMGKWKMQANLKILPPISTQGLSIDQRQELQVKAQKMFEEAYVVRPFSNS